MTAIVTQEITGNIALDDYTYHIVDAEVELSRYSQADMVEATIVKADDDAPEPEIEMNIVVNINDKRVFEGTVYESTYINDGSYEILAFDDTMKLTNNKVTLSITNETPLSTVVEKVADAAGIGVTDTLTWHTDTDRGAIDHPITLEVTEEPCISVLDTLAELGRAVWWVNEYNLLQFGAPETDMHQTNFILEASAGLTTPPYLGIEVLGDRSVTEKGWSYNPLTSLRPITVQRGIFNKGDGNGWFIADGELNTPVFRVTDQNIKTVEQARAVAETIARELLNQVKSGDAELVGNEQIQKNDVIQLPPSMGSATYYVGKITHILDNSKGFTTKIECEGLFPWKYYDSDPPGSEAVYNNEKTDESETESNESLGPRR